MRDAALDACLFALLVGLLFAPLEHVFGERRERRRSYVTDLAFATLGQLLTRGVLIAGLGALLAALASLSPRPLAHAGSFVHVTIGLVVFETMGYLHHRLAHAVPFLSRLHDVHHASTEMDWLASFRQHPLEIALLTLAQNAPLVLLGVPLGAHAAVVLLLRVHTVFVHSNVRVPEGPWSLVLATPRFHHRHHDRDRPAANFATLSPLLDRLFGTYDGARATVIGSATPMPRSFFGLLAHPFRRRARPVEHAELAHA